MIHKQSRWSPDSVVFEIINGKVSVSEWDCDARFIFQGPEGYATWVSNLWDREPEKGGRLLRLPWEATLRISGWLPSSVSILISSTDVGLVDGTDQTDPIRIGAASRWEVDLGINLSFYLKHEWCLGHDIENRIYWRKIPWTGYRFLIAYDVLAEAGVLTDSQKAYFSKQVFFPEFNDKEFNVAPDQSFFEGWAVPAETYPGDSGEFLQLLLRELCKRGYLRYASPKVVGPLETASEQALVLEIEQEVCDGFCKFLEEELCLALRCEIGPAQARKILQALPARIQAWLERLDANIAEDT